MDFIFVYTQPVSLRFGEFKLTQFPPERSSMKPHSLNGHTLAASLSQTFLSFVYLGFITILLSGCRDGTSSGLLISSSLSSHIKLTIGTSPGGGVANSIWLQQPVVEIRNADGTIAENGVESFATITAALYNSNGTLSGQTSVQAKNGIASFSDLAIDLVGTKQLRFSKSDTSNLGGTPSTYLDSPTFSITSATANKIVLIAQSEADPGECVAVQTVIQDSSGNTTTLLQATTILLSTLSSAQFFSDSACTISANSLNFLTSDSLKTFYVKNGNQERVYISAIDSNSILSTSIKAISWRAPTTLGFSLLTPSVASFSPTIVCQVSDLGKVNCNGSIVDIPELATKVASGLNAHCALSSLGKIFCWGANDFGQLGQGTTGSGTTNVASQVNLGGTASDLAAASYGFCAIVLISGVRTVKCWGNNSNRELGDGTVATRSSPVVASSLGLVGGVEPITISPELRVSGVQRFFIVLSDGTVKTLGGGANPSTLAGFSNVLKIAGVSNQSLPVYVFNYGINNSRIDAAICVLKNDNSIFCSGTNSNGQLGTGTVSSSAITSNIGPIANATDLALSAGELCVSTSSGKLYCSGDVHVSFSTEFIIPRRTLTEIPGFLLKNVVGHLGTICGITFNAPYLPVCRSDYHFLTSSTFSSSLGPLKKGLAIGRIAKTQISISTSAYSITKGTCVPISVSYYKNGSLASPEVAVDEISLADQSSAGSFYSSSDCTSTSLSKITLPTGLTTRNIFFKVPSASSAVGTIRILATPSDKGIAAGDLMIPIAGNVFKLGFFVGQANYTSTRSIGLADSMGNLIPIPSTSTLNLSWNNSSAMSIELNGTPLSSPANLTWLGGNSEVLNLSILANSCNGNSNVVATIPSFSLTATTTYIDDNGGCGN